MASLTLARWERWEPDLGDNRALPEGQRFWLELRAGLSKVELAAFQAGMPKIGDESDAMERYLDAWAQHIAPNIRMGGEPLVLDGQPVTTLRELVAAYLGQASLAAWREMFDAFLACNSLDGARVGFSARPSGGTSGTAPRSAARANNPTAAR